jgi:hypothetical protein
MANHTTDYDVIVVGSGFGGSVTALRLTRSPTTSPSARCRRRRTNCPSPSRPSTTGRRRIAVAGSGARCRGSDSCTSVAASHSSDRSAAGFPTIVGRVPIDVVQHQCEGQAQPRAGSATDRAAARLSVGEILPNVVTATGADRRLAGFEPTFGTGVAPDRSLTCITAVDLLAALRHC